MSAGSGGLNLISHVVGLICVYCERLNFVCVVLQPDNQALFLVAGVERLGAKQWSETNLASPAHAGGPVLKLRPRALMF